MVAGDLADNRKDDQRVQGPPYIDQARRGVNEYTAIYTTARIRALEHLRSTVKTVWLWITVALGYLHSELQGTPSLFPSSEDRPHSFR